MRVLIVGGGIGGMSAAVRLVDSGHEVEIVEVDPEWRVYGAGITITGPTLRAYRRLGLLDDVKRQGAIMPGSRIFRYDGTFLAQLDEPAIEEGLPATGGIMRPVLHRIMQRRVNALAIPVRLGLTVDALTGDADGVDVRFSDGSEGRYDIVVGADGIASKVRALAFPNAVEPMDTGQACWRLSTTRPEGFDRNEFFLGHENAAGLNACGPDTIYLWMLTRHEPGAWLNEAEAHERLRRELAEFGGTMAWVRDNMTNHDWINYRPLAAMIQPEPWATGRIVLLGDAAHATTPHLASGAGMAVEDGLVLSEELDVADRPVAESLRAYSKRRYPRCRHVVETSVAVGKLQLEGGSAERIGQLIGDGLHALAAEY
jgi:2-polyprenyl-6-methoxyphenol hydroxylase-like FAD-dependent oxidoreductase